MVHPREHGPAQPRRFAGNDGSGPAAGPCVHARVQRRRGARCRGGRAVCHGLAHGPDCTAGAAAAGRRAAGHRAPGPPCRRAPAAQHGWRQPAHGGVCPGAVRAARLQRRRRRHALAGAGPGPAARIGRAIHPPGGAVGRAQWLGRAGRICGLAGGRRAVAGRAPGRRCSTGHGNGSCHPGDRGPAAGLPPCRSAAGGGRLRRLAARRARAARCRARHPRGPAAARARRAPGAARCLGGAARCGVPLRAGPARGAARPEPARGAGLDDGAGGRLRLGQIVRAAADRALFRCAAGQRSGGWHRRAPDRGRAAGRADQPDLSGQLPFSGLHCRQHPHGPPAGQRCRGDGSRAPGRRGRNHRAPAAGPGHARGRGRGAPVGRRAPAHRHCPRAHQGRAHPPGR